jgi:predicted Zn finger-like uncharacterized protein
MAYAASAVHFICPNCSALYHVVKAEAGPDFTPREVTCLACGGPLPVRNRNFIFKYFLLRKAGRRQNHRRKPQRARETRI